MKTKITGRIMLSDALGNYSSDKKYNSKEDRQKIIDSWKKLYALDGKTYQIIIVPEISQKDILRQIKKEEEEPL